VPGIFPATFFERSDYILTTQTTKNQNMAGTNFKIFNSLSL